MNKKITRFAPSPTGNLHLGNIKSAIISWAYAKKKGGDFLLRIDDTDKKRSKRKYVTRIIKDLKWMGLNFDGIFFQSQRQNIYKKYLDKIIRKKKAIKRKDGSIKYLVRNKVSWFENKRIIIKSKNFTILRKDGTFTYNFCSAVDDIDMKVSNVFRSVDHINNTSKQIDIIDTIGKKPPVYFHFSNITNKKGKKFSKRLLDKSIYDFKKDGFLSEAIFNYIGNLGTENKDFCNRKEYIKNFDFKKIKKSPSKFNIKKLLWYNSLYIKKNKKKIRHLIKTKKKLFIFDSYLSRINKLNDIDVIESKIRFRKHFYFEKKVFFLFLNFLSKIKDIENEKRSLSKILKINGIENKLFFISFRKIIFNNKIGNLPISKLIFFFRKKICSEIIGKVLFI